MEFEMLIPKIDQIRILLVIQLSAEIDRFWSVRN